jgi:quercetin dioxygenase-like cupin family protein
MMHFAVEASGSRFFRSRVWIAMALFFAWLPTLAAQDVMQFKPKQLKVLAEDSKVRVLRFAPTKGDRTPMHSHPQTVVYVVKGGKIRLTSPDGSSNVVELKTGETQLRAPVTHADEALDDMEVILVELKK